MLGLKQVFDRAERRRLGGFGLAIAAIHVAGIGALLTYGAGHPAFLALGGLAYTFGLRHAFDADHISAIDNTTRKLGILLDILGVYRRMRSGHYDRAALQDELQAGGLMSRIFGRLFKLVSQSWHMYPIGFLFGLGFDTASEVALLAISAGAAAQH